MLLKCITGISLLLSVILFVCTNAPLWLLPVFFIGLFLLGALLAVAFLWICCARVDMSVPQEEDSKFYRRLMHPYIEALITLVGVRLHTKGLENTPKDGRFLLVCNHLFIADPGIVLHCFKNSQLAFVTKQENMKMFVVGPIMHKIMCQSLDRDNDRSALKTILKCIQILKEDKASIAVFPEGYESLDGRLLPFRPGVFKIAQKAQVPVVVCTLQGTEYVIRNLKKLKPIPPVQLHLLEVIPAEELAGQTTVQISQRVRELMLADLAEKYQPENQ